MDEQGDEKDQGDARELAHEQNLSVAAPLGFPQSCAQPGYFAGKRQFILHKTLLPYLDNLKY